MTKTETIQIMAMLGAFYSGGKNDPKLQAEAWYLILQKYDFKTAQKAVLNYAENDVRDYATFPAVGVIVKEIRNQQMLERRPIKEIIRSVSYGKGYEELSAQAKELIQNSEYNRWLDMNAEDFANNIAPFEAYLKKRVPMLGGTA